MAIRLKKADRERIIERLCAAAENSHKKRLDDELEALTTYLEGFITNLYGDDYPALLRWGCLIPVDKVHFKPFFGWWSNVKFTRPIPALARQFADNMNLEAWTRLGISPDVFQPMLEAFDAVHAEFKATTGTIRAAVYSAYNDEQLIALWPESAPIVREVVGQYPMVEKAKLGDAEFKATLPRLNVRLLTEGSTSPDE